MTEENQTPVPVTMNGDVVGTGIIHPDATITVTIDEEYRHLFPELTLDPVSLYIPSDNSYVNVEKVDD